MKKMFLLFLVLAIMGCNQNKVHEPKTIKIEQSELENLNIKEYNFLNCMYQDSYFPPFLVDKCKSILLELCNEIELSPPEGLKELYVLSHSATSKLNNLQDEFFENGSEIETVARECLAMDIEFISISYGYEADVEELISPREW